MKKTFTGIVFAGAVAYGISVCDDLNAYSPEEQIAIVVLVEVDAPDALIDAIRQQLRPTTAAVSLRIEVAELGAAPAIVPTTDLVVAIAGSGNVGLRQALGAPRQLRLPVVAISLGDESRSGALADALLQPTGDLIVRDEPDEAVARLGAWIADNVASKRLAFAHNFAFMRRAVAEDAMKTTALQNGILGAVTPIPGADMPIMTANQIKMLLQIAAAYGQPLGVDRVKELAAVVAGGYLLRAVARQALVAVPVLGWAIKGGIGYTGTMAMGRAAVRYFENGADLGELTAYFRSVRDAALTTSKRFNSRPLRRLDRHALPAAEQLALEPATSRAVTIVSDVTPVEPEQSVLPIGELEPTGE